MGLAKPAVPVLGVESVFSGGYASHRGAMLFPAHFASFIPRSGK